MKTSVKLPNFHQIPPDFFVLSALKFESYADKLRRRTLPVIFIGFDQSDPSLKLLRENAVDTAWHKVRPFASIPRVSPVQGFRRRQSRQFHPHF